MHLKSKIPRFNPCLDWCTIGNTLKVAFNSNLSGDKKESRRFEEKFAEYIGVRNAIFVPSGRIGLYLILKNLGLKEQAGVILPSFNYWAVPRIVIFLNLHPFFVDIDLRTCNLDISLIERNITRETKVILPTHLYGLPCEMDAVIEIAKRYNLWVIEDCAQSCGAEYKGKRVGSIGDAAYFSFGITKNLSILGGGMVTTNGDKLANKIRNEVASYNLLNRCEILKEISEAILLKLFTNTFVFSSLLYPLIYLLNRLGNDVVHNLFLEKDSGSKLLLKDEFRLVPVNIKNTVGIRGLMYLGAQNNKRIKNAAYVLSHLKNLNGVILPPLSDTFKNIFFNFPIRIKNRNILANELLRRGIDTSKGYMKAWGENCPNAKTLEQEILHIPIYSSLSEVDLIYLTQMLKEIIEDTN